MGWSIALAVLSGLIPKHRSVAPLKVHHRHRQRPAPRVHGSSRRPAVSGGTQFTLRR